MFSVLKIVVWIGSFLVLRMLAQAGSHDKPSLSAWPSPVVPNGQHVEIRCESNKYNTFKLYKEHGEPVPPIHDRIFQKRLLLGPVTQAYAGTYRCYDYNCQCPSELSSHSDPLEIIISGIYRNPFLLVLSTPLVKSREKMTLECHSEIMFDTFILTSHRKQIINGSFQLPAESHHWGSHATFSIGPVTPDHAGVYTRYGSYNQTPYEWSESSDPVDIMIIGINNKPTLSAWPSHVIPQGQNVTLTCDTHSVFNKVKLYKEHGDPKLQVHNGMFQRSLILGPVTPAFGGTYRCYSYKPQYRNELSSHSEPLKIIISGIYRKPFLLALPTPLVKLGEKATLKCHSEIMFDIFILTSHRMGINKDSYQLSAEYHFGGSHANFPIGPVTPEHAGTYTCYGSYKQTPYEWSESSDPVDIKITGLYKKPSLSALMGTVVTSGENMTLTSGENKILSCTSDHQFDLFHLSMKGVPLGHGLPAEQSHSGTFQANFFPVPLIQAETYRCYGSFRNSSHVWSSPSDPLFFSVSVNSSRNFTSCAEPDSKTNNHGIMNILIGLSVTMMSVFFIILLYSCCSAKKSKSQEQARQCHLSSVRNQDWKNTAIMDQECESRTTLNRQNPERQEVQEVAYLEFDQLIFKQKLPTPISQIPKEFSTDPSVYVEVRKC